MAARFLQLRDAVDTLTRSSTGERFKMQKLHADDWDLLADLVKALECFSTVTKLLEGEKNPTLLSLLPLFVALQVQSSDSLAGKVIKLSTIFIC